MDRTRRIIFGLALLFSPLALAEAPRYNTAKVLPPPTKAELKDGSERVELPRDLRVPKTWLPYLNPAFEEFWSEGQHRPDAGFLLFARNPTPENARLWLIRMETKAKLLTTMWDVVDAEYQSLIKQGVIEDRYGIIKSQIATKAAQTPKAKGLADTQIYFLFNPNCPHCQTLSKAVRPLASRILPLQVGGETLKHLPGFSPSSWADKQTIKDYVQGSVPVLVITNTKTGQTSVLRGVQNLETILRSIEHVAKSS